MSEARPHGGTTAGLLAVLVTRARRRRARRLATHKRQVTIAARVCPSYEAITANRARNNIQESLRDLGADTPYGTRLPDGRLIPNLIDPAIEAEFQPDCAPLQGVAFKLGRGISGHDSGIWGELSKVSGPYAEPEITTENRTRLLDEFGQPVPGGVFIEGATTISSRPTRPKTRRAARSCGSRAACPAGRSPATRNVYAFGALRCATDNLNGDNVEWIAYPVGGVNHVFCFAYYVSAGADGGKIIVEKQIVAPAGAPPQSFRFTGNISYEPETPGGTRGSSS